MVKKFPVKRFYRARNIGGRNHQADIQQRSALRHHPHMDIFQRAENARGDTRRSTDILTHQAHDRVIFFDRYLGEGFQLPRESRQENVCCR